MKIRNLFISLCFSLMVVGCANNTKVEGNSLELKLVDKYSGEYEVGFPIDVENFFYYSDRTQVDIFVAYTRNGRNYSDEVFGNTYTPKYSGDYLFTCSSTVKSLNKRVTVVETKPTLSVSDAATFVQTNEKLSFKELFNLVNPAYTPSTAKLEAFNVQYAPYTFDISSSLTEPLVDYDFNSDGFTPKKPGLYRVHIRVSNGLKFVDGVINVVASARKRDGNENVYKNDSGTYASNKLIASEKIIDTFVLPASLYSQAAYVVLDPLYKNGDTIGIRFKGKNIPSVGLLASPDLAGSYAISSITGYLLSFERRLSDRFTLYLPMNNVTMKDGQQSRGEFFGVNDMDEDTYYYLTASIVGNTYNSSSKKYSHSVHFTMCEIENYGETNEYYKTLVKVDVSGGWSDDYDIAEGRVVLYSSEKRDIVFQIDGLPTQGNMIQHGGAKREGYNNYAFENSRTTTYNAKTGAKNTVDVRGYIAFKGNYGAGDSISFTFKGFNIPSVALFCDISEPGPEDDYDPFGLTGGAKGMYICSGSGDKSLNKRLTFYGPYRLDSSKKEGYISPDGKQKEADYAGIFWNYRCYTDESSPFGYDNLSNDGDYLYTIKIMQASEDTVIITCILYDKQHGEYECVAQKTFYIWSYTGPTSGAIIAYPNYNGMAKYTTFATYPVNTSPLTDKDYFAYRSSYEVEDEWTTVNISKRPTIEGNTNDLKDASYLGVRNICEVGKTLRIKYVGQNIPNVCLFTDSIYGQAIGGGRGVFLGTSYMQTTDDPAVGAKSNQHQLMPFAPYRWAAEFGKHDLTDYRYNDQKRTGMGYLDHKVDTKYEYTIKTTSLSGGYIDIQAKLIEYNTDDTVAKTTDCNLHLNLYEHMNLGEKLAFGPNIIFYGQGADITFAYTVE